MLVARGLRVLSALRFATSRKRQHPLAHAHANNNNNPRQGVFENAIDMAHIHYLHSDSFGNSEQPRIMGMHTKRGTFHVEAAFRCVCVRCLGVWFWRGRVWGGGCAARRASTPLASRPAPPKANAPATHSLPTPAPTKRQHPQQAGLQAVGVDGGRERARARQGDGEERVMNEEAPLSSSESW